jgi:hypothetical protein
LKLACLATEKNRPQLATFLLEYERDPIKKIPFLLEHQDESHRAETLQIAMDSLDPNHITNVLSHLFSGEPDTHAKNI